MDSLVGTEPRHHAIIPPAGPSAIGKHREAVHLVRVRYSAVDLIVRTEPRDDAIAAPAGPPALP